MFEGDSDDDMEDISDRLEGSTIEGASTVDGEERGIVWSKADMINTVTPSLSIVQVSIQMVST